MGCSINLALASGNQQTGGLVDAGPLYCNAHGLIGNAVAEIRERSGDAIVTPAAVLASHTDDQFRYFTSDGRSPRIEPLLRAVELVSDQLAKPGQDCIWLGSGRDCFESSTSEPFANGR